ncbi:DUF4342 domain-containing protein [Alkaliphilus sp. B6464]|uniref:DUF4342 domain-containing protein n=1 Tax=Alkaliphilus sp. B6464 TaxID=2731219 RepID=UPI001BAB1E81|nr:DUF4342 domain-containing protein [Alkaliphilus sp. B6464]QUH21036.1 DUF4342 domain-containing protein [Alkaliphilus sp. B6464]
MDINLEKVDIVRERTGVSYKEAKEALEQNNGDVVESIIAIEEKNGKTWMNTMSLAGNEVIEKLKYLIKKGNVSRVMLKRDGEILLNVPVTAGAIGVMLAPIVSLLGVSAAIATKTTIEIIKNNGEIVDINEMAGETVSELKNMVRGKKGVDVDMMKKESDIILDKEDQDETLDDLYDGADY